MDVLHDDIGVGHRQVVVGEVPEALDPQRHQTATDLLCAAAGQTEDGHLGVMLGAERLQLIDVENLDAVDLLANLIGGVVEAAMSL